MKKICQAFGILSLISLPAFGQPEAPPTPAIDLEKNFFASTMYQSYVEQAFNALEPAPLKAECPVLKFRNFTGHLPIKPLQFAKVGKGISVIAGAWIAEPDIDRCGQSARRRILMTVKGPNQIDPIPLLPGEFRGDLQLEIDARRIVMPIIKSKARCTDDSAIYVLNVAFMGGDPKDWKESWTAQACEQPVTVNVHYFGTPDGGVDIAAEYPKN